MSYTPITLQKKGKPDLLTQDVGHEVQLRFEGYAPASEQVTHVEDLVEVPVPQDAPKAKILPLPPKELTT